MIPPCHVLYIDDDAGIRRLVERDLLRSGCQVTLADSGPTGESLAAQQQFDVICLDHYMPGQDGLETLKRLRALSISTPIIFVTGSEEGRLVMAALREGATSYVIKETGADFLPLLRLTIGDVLAREHLQRSKEQALRDLQSARDQAEELAEQRAVLLREVNHRVANSLQLITSLMMLQESSARDPAIRTVLAEVRGRIFAVAQVHRRLYTSDDVTSVELAEYLDGLLNELARSIGDGPDKTTIVLEAESLQLPTDKAVSLGVILAELVTNAVKYAYPDGGGTVRVKLLRDQDGAVLRVEDDGKGDTSATPAGTGLGQKVIKAMADSIGARVHRESSPAGFHVAVRFAVEHAQGQGEPHA